MSRTKNFDAESTLDRAIELFRKQGYQATTPAQLVEHMKISRSSLYDTYGDKRALYIKALRRYADRIEEQFNAIVANAGSGKEGIRGYMDLSLEGCFGENMPAGCLLVNSVAELPGDELELLSIITDSTERSRKLLLKLLKRAQSEGELSARANLPRLADYLMNAVSGLTISAKSGVSKKICQQVVDTTLSILD